MSDAQQVPVLSERATAVKSTASSLAIDAPISVLKVRGPEQFGKFLSCNDEGFTFLDVDLNRNFILRYEEVRKIKNGYGGLNRLHHRHTDRTKNMIVGVVVLGVLGGLIAAVASAKN